MAKKKVVKSDTSRKTKKSVAKKSVAKKTSNSRPVKGGSQRSLTSDEIGHVAGDVWHLLVDSNDVTLASIKKSVDAPEPLVLAALGWLAREGKLQFSTNGRSTKISLN